MGARQSLTLLLIFLVLSLFCASNANCEENAFDKGTALYKKGKYEEALPLLRSASALGMSRPSSIYYLAMCYQQLGDLKQARDSYKLICTQYPNSALFDRSFSMLKDLEQRLSSGSTKPGRSSTGGPGVLKLNSARSQSFPVSVWDGGETYQVSYSRESDGRMYLDGILNGKLTKFLFDTGAGVTFCRQSFVNKLEVKLDWISESAIIPGAMGEAPAKVAICKISLGKFTRENKIYVEQDRPDSYYPALDNIPIIGQSFFGDLMYRVDGRAGLITFKKVTIPKGPIKPGRLGPGEVPFFRDGAHMIVKAKVNDRECDMIFDTGASQVVFADRHLAQCGLNRPVDATSSTKRGSGSVRDSYAFKIDRLTLGPIDRQDVNVAVLVNTKFSKPLLGQTFLKDLVYTVDPVRNVIRFETFN
ncbi:MAG: retroviral-like aspartic protease family protein [Candidatus Obscuribacterales bacterium]|nr:retroviral-like aspartic protease family protein [Candidatus Obscuribacterales bacterium]